ADGERILSYSPGGPFSRFTVRDLDGKVLTELNVDNAVSTAMTLQRDYVYRGSQLLAAHTADPSPKDPPGAGRHPLATAGVSTDWYGRGTRTVSTSEVAINH
ncbi:MAG TPA: hypothetical protein VLF66_11495, partial [Thermoanaerobaculia bacterium]|nr:hypothetical protein [Thermoanaerobaculia bacterium]